MKYSYDNKVSFNEKNHVYKLGDKKLESVTSFIRRHTNIFDAPNEAIKYAKKRGLNADEVLAMWEKKGKESRDAGTATHLVFENYFKTGKIEVSGAYKKELIAKKIIEDLFTSGRLTPVHCEYIVYNETLAGQIDMIAKDVNNKKYILDWKTNEEIKDNSWGRFMLGEYSKIPDASYYHYSLQVELYEKMYPEEIEKSYIVHLKDEDYTFYNPFEL